MALSDSDIQRITEAVKSRLSDQADEAAIARAVAAAAGDAGEPATAPPVATAPDAVPPAAEQEPRPPAASERPAVDIHPEFEHDGCEGNRIVVAAFGHNRPGVAAALTAVLAECNCDIADITQKILQEFFSMIVIVDIAAAAVDFATLRQRLSDLESRIGITVLVQH
ncbi:MAG TPA: ACT domain-containing protein [Acidobacteriota bacterium]|nr:ACT domain-containing protein [Acidobacteriota bacterium]